LLIDPTVASSASLFATMVVENTNTIAIGEETMGGYYGNNGHSSLEYKLPKSKIEFYFSVVNLEQDVVTKDNQKYNSGIIPTIEVVQSFEDFLTNKDTQLNFTKDFRINSFIKIIIFYCEIYKRLHIDFNIYI